MPYEYKECRKTIIIAHPSRKKQYLSFKADNPYLDMEIMSLEELKGMFDYQYDDRAVCFMLSKGYGYKVSKEMLKAFSSHHYEKGIEVKRYDSLREELIAKRYLFKTPYPNKTFEDADIIVSGYFTEDEIIKEYLGDVSLIHDEEEQYEKPLKDILSFDDIYEELHYVYNQIALDVDQGTSINDIFIYGVEKEHSLLLRQFSKYYGFQVNVEEPCRLHDTNIYRLFRKTYLESGLEAAIEGIRKEYQDSKDADTIEKFARVFDPVFPLDKEKTISIFDEIAKEKTKYAPKKKDVVAVLNEAICPKGSHMYFLNFSMGAYPKASSGAGFWSDEEKERLGLDNASSLSHRDYGIVDHALRSEELKLITFASDIFGTSKFECAFKDKYEMKVIDNPRSEVEYAIDKGAFLCAVLQDSKRNYLEEDDRRGKYEEITGISVDYPKYDHSFKGSKKGRKKTREYSYSNLKDYKDCPFKYLMSNVLGLNENDTSFGVSIGKVFHGVFEQYYKELNPDFDFDAAFDKAVSMEQGFIPDPSNTHNERKEEFSSKEKAIIENLREYCRIALNFQRRYEQFLHNPKFYPEQSFRIALDNGVVVSGRYDKITEFEHDGKKYCFIIDYKTGKEFFDERLFRKFSLSLQLPIYAMAIAKGKASSSDVSLAGMFISPILKGFTLENEKGTPMPNIDNEILKLKGVFLNDYSLFNKIDPLMEEKGKNSSYISGLSLKKDEPTFATGKSKEYTKHKTEAEFKELGDIAERKIKELDERIVSGDFKIDPLMIKSHNDACEYCTFHDVCYIDKRKIKVVSPNGSEVKEEEENEDGESAE